LLRRWLLQNKARGASRSPGSRGNRAAVGLCALALEFPAGRQLGPRAALAPAGNYFFFFFADFCFFLAVFFALAMLFVFSVWVVSLAEKLFLR
jgi:hypothetical protein